MARRKHKPKEPAGSSPVPITDQIIVGFNTDPTLDRIEVEKRIADALHKLHNLPATVLKRFVKSSPDGKLFFAFALIRLDDPELTLDVLQQRLRDKDPRFDDIVFFERNAPVATAAFADVLSPQQWALPRIGATQIWTRTPPPGPKTIVAIVDSGLRRFGGGVHADLGLVEPGGGIDSDGHGTLLAGTIAARPGNGQGIASAVPVTWNISLLSEQFFTPTTPPNAFDAAAGIALAVLAGAKVINASWHVPPGDSGLAMLKSVITIALSTSIVVMAAGNEGTDNEKFPIYPANFGAAAPIQGNVLTVLATDRYDRKAFFSNYGRNIVDLGAPGMRILSTARYLGTQPRYAEYSGTSAAAAYVSAGAALVFALNPLNWDNAGAPAWTPGDVIQHLKTSASTVHDLRPACVGGRRLNLRRAVYGPLRVVSPAAGAAVPAGIPVNITWTLRYTNPKFQRVKIEFTRTGTDPYTVLSPAAGWLIGVPFPWTPNNPADKTATARIRITPLEGNFPKRSALFRVV
jgi:subtilisin family serine protease